MKTYRNAFTLVELLTTIAIIAAMVVGALVVVPSFVNWASQTRDKQTLTTLNDALTRYKTQGGDLSSLMAGTPIGNVLAKMASTINWNGMIHQVMQKGVTYPARSLSVAGNGTDYHFTRFNTYTESIPSASTPTDTYPYGQGVAYASNNNNPSGYSIYIVTDGAPYVVKTSGGQYYYGANSGFVDIPQCQSITVWACTSMIDSTHGNPTPSGHIILYYDDNGNTANYASNLTSLNVSGLTALQELYCYSNQLTSLNVSGCTALQSLDCYSNQLTSLNVSGLTALQYLYCYSNQLTSLNVSGLTALGFLGCSVNQLTTLNVSGLAVIYLDCTYNNLGANSINITGHEPSTFVYTPQNNGYTPTVIGP